ncbi:MAG: N-acetylmuramoyl-L-alanine amidase [bacterium]|nr:N-acetylmuramoyl-L-alanine amidase [bacterium]
MNKFSIIILICFISFNLYPITVYGVEQKRILIVPGHDDESVGAEYANLKEADMNLRLATELHSILKKDKRFKVYITRDSKGHTKEFANYFVEQREEIIAFKENSKKQMAEKMANGSVVQVQGLPHNAVNQDTAIKLYGINKWANENKIDAVVHVHFNDYARPTKWAMGKYKGFNIYVPEEQLVNSKDSVSLAEKIFTQLRKKYSISTYETQGIVPDQKLIALGAHGSLDKNVRSILIEYGYIYRFGNAKFRHKAYKDMSALTATGLKNYFFKK